MVRKSQGNSCYQHNLMIDNRDGGWERVREIHATSTTWWWIIGMDGERVPGKSMLPAQLDDECQANIYQNQIFKINMQISLPVNTTNCYLVVHINTIACYQRVNKANNINNIKDFLNNWDLNKNKTRECNVNN